MSEETYAASGDNKTLVVTGEVGGFRPDEIDAHIAQLTARKAKIDIQIAKWQARKDAAIAEEIEGAS